MVAVRVDSETEDDYEEWIPPAQPRHAPEPAALPPSQPRLGEIEDEVSGEQLPLTQPEVQSWQTNVSAYSYPSEVLGFFDMLEEGA